MYILIRGCNNKVVKLLVTRMTCNLEINKNNKII